MGADHAPVDAHKKPHVTIKAPWYEPLLANKSKLCPPDFHYNREIWYPHGGFYSDPVGWRQSTAVMGVVMVGLAYLVCKWGNEKEIRHMPPKGWIPSIMWNSHVPDPVDWRGRTLDRVTGKIKDIQPTKLI